MLICKWHKLCQCLYHDRDVDNQSLHVDLPDMGGNTVEVSIQPVEDNAEKSVINFEHSCGSGSEQEGDRQCNDSSLQHETCGGQETPGDIVSARRNQHVCDIPPAPMPEPIATHSPPGQCSTDPAVETEHIDPAVETEHTDPAVETEHIDPAVETEHIDPPITKGGCCCSSLFGYCTK